MSSPAASPQPAAAEPEKKHWFFLKVMVPLGVVLVGGVPAYLTYFRGAGAAVKDPSPTQINIAAANYTVNSVALAERQFVSMGGAQVTAEWRENFSTSVEALAQARPADAISLLEKLNAVREIPAVLNNLAVAWLQSGDEAKAKLYFSKALQAAPGLESAQNNAKLLGRPTSRKDPTPQPAVSGPQEPTATGAVKPDRYEPNEGPNSHPTPIRLGQTLSASFHSETDTDAYRIEPDGGGKTRVYLQNLSETMQPIMSVRDSLNAQFDHPRNHTGGGHLESVFERGPGKEYYVVVNAMAGAPANYRLSILRNE